VEQGCAEGDGWRKGDVTALFWGVWKDNRRTSRDLLYCRFNIATCSATYVSTPQTFAQS